MCFMILSCLFQYKNEAPLDLTRSFQCIWKDWSAGGLHSATVNGNLIPLRNPSVRWGSFSSWIPVSLVAILISWVVLLHSVGDVSFGRRNTSKLRSLNKSLLETDCKQPRNHICKSPILLFILIFSLNYLNLYEIETSYHSINEKEIYYLS